MTVTYKNNLINLNYILKNASNLRTIMIEDKTLIDKKDIRSEIKALSLMRNQFQEKLTQYKESKVIIQTKLTEFETIKRNMLDCINLTPDQDELVSYLLNSSFITSTEKAILSKSIDFNELKKEIAGYVEDLNEIEKETNNSIQIDEIGKQIMNLITNF